MARQLITRILNRLERASELDGVSDQLQKIVSSVVRPQAVGDLLHL